MMISLILKFEVRLAILIQGLQQILNNLILKFEVRLAILIQGLQQTLNKFDFISNIDISRDMDYDRTQVRS
jgi:hypothetical protein